MAGHKSRWLDKSPPCGRLIRAFSRPAALRGILDLLGLIEQMKKKNNKNKRKILLPYLLGEPVVENDSRNLEELPLFIYSPHGYWGSGCVSVIKQQIATEATRQDVEEKITSLDWILLRLVSFKQVWGNLFCYFITNQNLNLHKKSTALFRNESIICQILHCVKLIVQL